ncbi:MarR family winged helix-turn-helix transcriptional regulator [Spirillospora albida]|uniref:MarR family winged helix-turn-helix transcriptional regulator n=1 Tax=Spirillospora albida TaxID=58123 RepID=UPI000565528B|nr:MarR family transcriptional regulator [Spirillospora albida]
MSADADPVVTELIELIFQAGGRLRAEFNAAAAELDLPPAQAMVLTDLTGPTPMRTLADRLSCEPSNVTGIIDGLERRGLATRRPDPADRRVKQVVLTAEGERRRDHLRARGRAQAEAFLALTPAERLQLRDFLARITGGSGGRPSCGPATP